MLLKLGISFTENVPAQARAIESKEYVTLFVSVIRILDSSELSDHIRPNLCNGLLDWAVIKRPSELARINQKFRAISRT